MPPVESRSKAPGQVVRGRSPLKLTRFQQMKHTFCIENLVKLGEFKYSRLSKIEDYIDMNSSLTLLFDMR